MTDGANTPIVLPYAIAPAPSRRGKGFLAGCGNTIFPGVGHFIAGANRRGMFWLGLAGILYLALIGIVLTPSMFVFVLPGFVLVGIISIAALVDAYLAGRRSKRRLLGRPVWRYSAGLVMVTTSWPVGRLLAVFVRGHFFEAFVEQSQSMSPTINPGDRFIVVKGRLPKRWDIVVFRHTWGPNVNPRPSMFRVVGLPGETVEVGDQVLINGSALTPPAMLVGFPHPFLGVVGRNGIEGNPIHLGPGEYFVLGDSPYASDSRYWPYPMGQHQPGAVPTDNIIGVVSGIYWPLSREKALAN